MTARLEHLQPHEIQIDRAKIRNGNDIDELAKSLRAEGMQQPIGVTEDELGNYHLVWGYRRLAAAKIAGLSEVPVLVVDSEDEVDALKMAMIENMVREDMTAIDKAIALRRLIDETDLTLEKVGKIFGYGQPWVSQHLALLEPEVQEAVHSLRKGATAQNLTVFHVREMKDGFSGQAAYKKHGADVLRKVIEEGLSARDAKDLAAEWERSDKVGGAKMVETLKTMPFKQKMRADTDVKDAFFDDLYKRPTEKRKKEIAEQTRAREDEQKEYVKEFGAIVKDDDYWYVHVFIRNISRLLTQLNDKLIPKMVGKIDSIKREAQKSQAKQYAKTAAKDLRDVAKRCNDMADMIEGKEPKKGGKK